MDISEIRRSNLHTLVLRYGGQAKLGELIDTDPAYISQILSPRTRANMGNRFARKVEDMLNLERGWMDQPHETDAAINEPSATYRHGAGRVPEAAKNEGEVALGPERTLRPDDENSESPFCGSAQACPKNGGTSQRLAVTCQRPH